MEVISMYSNAISLTASLVGMLFMAYHFRFFRYKILIPFSFAISGIVFNEVGNSWVSDIVYDIAIVITILVTIYYCLSEQCNRYTREKEQEAKHNKCNTTKCEA